MRFINNHESGELMRVGSSGSGESYDFCVLSEAFSAEEEVILSDQTHLAFAVSALSAILSEFSSVSSPEQVWHSLWLFLINIYYLSIFYLFQLLFPFLIRSFNLFYS